MSKKHSKNLQKVQDMLDGKGTGKIQSGYMPTEEEHKVGDKWTDSDGVKWEQKKGYRVKLTKLASAGIAEQCSDCEKYITKPWDKEIFKFNEVTSTNDVAIDLIKRKKKKNRMCLC